MASFGTKAISVPCRACGEDAGKPCLAIVDGCVMDAGRYHRQRVIDAGAATKVENLKARRV